MQRVLLIYPGALGDVLFSRVVLFCLKRHYPECKIDYAGMPQYLRLLAGEIHQIIDYNDGKLLSLFSPSATLSPPCQTWLQEYDGIIFWSSTERLEQFAKKLESIKKPAVIVATVTPQPDSNEHVALTMLRTLKPWGMESTATLIDNLPELRPPLPGKIEPAITEQLNSYIVVHPGSGSKKKNWQLSKFMALMAWIEQKFQTKVICLLGPAEMDYRSALSKANCLLVEPGDVLSLANWLKGAQFYLGNDSGVTHLAAQLGCKTFVLFVSTNPSCWRPMGKNVVVITNQTFADFGPGPYFCQGLTVTEVENVIQQNTLLQFSTTVPN